MSIWCGRGAGPECICRVSASRLWPIVGTAIHDYACAMKTLDPSSQVALDADAFAAVIGGTWLVRPSGTWRFPGMCWHEGGYVPGRVVLAKGDGFRYGIDLKRLKPAMASAVLVIADDAPRHFHGPVLRVDSIPLAVRRLAIDRRANTSTTIFAVTGSVGKTSSCYLLSHLLEQAGSVAANGQFNYPDGIVGEACNLGQVDYAVIEASLQGLGEATAKLQPHVAVLTNISPVHLDQAGSLLALAERKASLFGHLTQGGAAVINRDISYFDRVLEIARATAETVFTFGKYVEADFRLTGYDLARQRVSACILGENVEYELGLDGEHMALNSLGAVAAVHAAGIAWKPLLQFFASARVVAGRGTLEQLKIGRCDVSILDDTYNASPAAMKAAFRMLAATAPTGCGRRIAVLGDTLELGNDAVEYHRALAKSLLESGVEKVYLAGELMRNLWEELPTNVRTPYRADAAELLRPLVRDLKDGDVVLLKGSHGAGVHHLTTDLQRMSLMPNLAGAGPATFIFLRAMARRLEPVTPRRLQNWMVWQLSKLTERNAVKRG